MFKPPVSVPSYAQKLRPKAESALAPMLPVVPILSTKRVDDLYLSMLSKKNNRCKAKRRTMFSMSSDIEVNLDLADPDNQPVPDKTV